jgi:hypothetical protein
MTADIARVTYDPNRPWRAVIPQQGRVTLEADINEQTTIAGETLRRQTLELVGPVAIPRPADGSAPGYMVAPTPDGSDVSISPGAIYVAGWRNSLAQALTTRSQALSSWLDMPAWPAPDGAPPDGDVLVALLLIEQSVVAVEDQSLLEVALGGPDSAARQAVLQRVLLIPTASGSYTYPTSYAQGSPPDPLVAYLAAQGFAYDPATAMLASTATLQVTTAGYAGPDNQMIRVAIASYDGTANGTLVWAGDNASFLYRAQGTPGTQAGQSLVLTFLSAPVDPDHQPQPGQAVEILRATMALDGGSAGLAGDYIAAGAGLVVPLGGGGASYDPSSLQLTLPAASLVTPTGTPQPFLADLAAGLPVFVRLWRGQVAFTGGAPAPLGTTGLGVTITLPAGVPPLPGAIGNPPFWHFAVRTNTPQQPCPQRYLTPQPPDGPRQAMAILGVASCDGGIFQNVNPTSAPFLPLSQLTPSAPSPPAFHVTGINWVNDDVMTLDWLIYQGLKLTLDNPPSSPIDSRNFLVTLWMPDSQQLVWTVETNRSLSRPPPVTLAGTVTVNGGGLTWLPSRPPRYVPGGDILAELANTFQDLGQFMQARVTLKGHAIFGTIAAQPAWLDGQCFGVNGGLSADGKTPRIDLNLGAGVASGNGAKASDFESWFQVAPPPFLELDIYPAEVQIVAGATAPAIEGLVTLQSLHATPASANSTIVVSLSSSDTISTSCPSSIVLDVGPNGVASTGTFSISIVTPPGNGQSATVTFTAQAELPSTYQVTSSSTLTIEGPPVPPLTLALSPAVVNSFYTGTITGTLTLAAAATAFTPVSLTSSNATVAEPPASIDIGAGATSATFTFSLGSTFGIGVGNTAQITITAALPTAASSSATLSVTVIDI